MKNQKALTWLVIPIFVLALFAAGMGLFDSTPGESYAYETLRGEQVTINMQGLYRFDTVSSAAQMQANDLITLIIGLPLLVISAILAFRGSLRGRLLLTGTLGFFFYTYMSMSMLTAYNNLFLVYVALFGLSFYAFILSLLSFDLEDLPRHFSEKLPRGWMAAIMFLVGAFLSLAWLGRIIPPLLNNTIPLLEGTTTLVIQAMDLVLIVPMAILGGILLLKRSPWGYLISSILFLKSITLGVAVSTMSIFMAARGVPESLGVMIPFLIITALNLIFAIILLRNIDSRT
ncbi:MAG: hypothetical protein GX577_04530 [Leptolinea sp.]|nr:hypothetical protein [Leptolinea sp.]